MIILLLFIVVTVTFTKIFDILKICILAYLGDLASVVLLFFLLSREDDLIFHLGQI